MNPNYPLPPPYDDHRQSKRLSRSENQHTTAEILHKYNDRPSQKLAEKKWSEDIEQPSTEGEQEKKEECFFSGEPLTSVELHQLFVKYTTDGHFYPNPRPSHSQLPLFISETGSEESLTTDATKQTIFDPLPDTLNYYLPWSHPSIASTSIISKSDNHCDSRTNYPTTSKRPSENGLDLSSERITKKFANSTTKQSLFTDTKVDDPLEQLDATENGNKVNFSTFHSLSSNGHFDNSVNMMYFDANREKAHNDPRGILNNANLSLMPSQYDAYRNFDVTGTVEGFRQAIQNNPMDLSIPADNQSSSQNSSNIRSPTIKIDSNSFDNDLRAPATQSSRRRKTFRWNVAAGSLQQRNLLVGGKYRQRRVKTRFGYNSTKENLSNNFSYEQSEIGNVTIVNNND